MSDTPRTDEAVAQVKVCVMVEGQPIFAEAPYVVADLARQLERELAEDCEDCDHGIRGGAVCQSCGGSGRVTFKSLYEATAKHVKALKAELAGAKRDALERAAKACETEWRKDKSNLDFAHYYCDRCATAIRALTDDEARQAEVVVSSSIVYAPCCASVRCAVFF